MKSCPKCKKEAMEGWVSCPYCGTGFLPEACNRCGKEMQAEWVVCPYCGSDRKGSGVSAEGSQPVSQACAFFTASGKENMHAGPLYALKLETPFEYNRLPIDTWAWKFFVKNNRIHTWDQSEFKQAIKVFNPKGDFLYPIYLEDDFPTEFSVSGTGRKLSICKEGLNGGLYLISVSKEGNVTDRTIVASTVRRLNPYPGGSDNFSWDDRMIAYITEKAELKCYDIDSGTDATVHSPEIFSASWGASSKYGNILFFAYKYNVYYCIIDSIRNLQIETLPCKSAQHFVVSKDGNMLATDEAIYDISDLSNIRLLFGLENFNQITKVCWTCDDRVIINDVSVPGQNAVGITIVDPVRRSQKLIGPFLKGQGWTIGAV